MFEIDSYGNEVLLQAIVEGYTPSADELKPNKTTYARSLYYVHHWSRNRIMQVLEMKPGMLALALRPPWLGLPETHEVEPDWKAAYEAATVREQNLKNENLILSARIRRAQEYATELRSSHPSRLEYAKAVGDALWRRVT